ncbi:hypothetical protein IWQ57_003320 [Coemansia nantahalensis]|uniref:Uncharacterized protein n=1 Tax=Coemansia nantahalensis TaxID=2789366 RepID=A0ACC1JXB0_9FUNG|nr:hypothetical protein IWQ57_003320 [Coemansia nantahalensis]
MHISSLPEDIHICILKAAGHAYIYEDRRWGRSLSLLAVCRAWRRLGRPLLYGGLYIHLSDAGKLLTNADLVAAVGACGLVRYMDIAAYGADRPLCGLDRILGTLEDTAPAWPGVRKVVLDIWHPHDVRAGHSSDDEAALACQTACRLTRLIPNVRKLILDGQSLPGVSALHSQLASTYAGQLQMLESSLAMCLPTNPEFANLTVLSIDFGSSSGFCIPQVAPSALVSLSLTGIHSYDIWDSFGSSPEVVFSSLTHLRISYGFGVFDPATRTRPCSTKLCFPRLKCLAICNVYSYCPVIAHGAFPQRLDLLDTECSTSILGLLGKIRFQSLRKAVIAVVCDDTDILRALQDTSRLTAAAAGNATAKISVISGQMDAHDVDIDWGGATALRTLASTSLSAMLAILARAPALCELMVHDLALDDREAHVAASALEDLERNPPPCLPSKVTHLLVGYRSYMYSVDAAVAAVKYLLLCMPSLKKLTTFHIPFAPIAAFISAHKTRFPHLAGVELVFNDLRDDHHPIQ